MNVIKKGAIMTLCIIMVISSMAITSFAATTKTEINNSVRARFTENSLPASPAGSINTSGRNAEITASFIKDFDGNNYAGQFDVTATDSGAIKLSNAPSYTQILWTGTWNRNATNFSYDFKINSFASEYINDGGEDAGYIMGLDIRDASGSELNGYYMGANKKTTAKTDGTIGDATYTVGKWYNMKVVFNYKMHTYSAYLTDKETGTVTTVAKYEEIDARARNMENAYIEFYRPCNVAIGNLRWTEERDFGIYPWSITTNASGAINDGDAVEYSNNKIAVGVPADAKSAALYLDDVKQADIPVGTSDDNIYKLGYTPATVGNHVLRLEMTDANDNVYTDTYSFKDAKAYSVNKSREYDFTNGTAYNIGQRTNGGVAGTANVDDYKKITITPDVNGESVTSFKYNGQAVNNVYVQGRFNGINYGILSTNFRIKLMQTNEAVAFSFEERPSKNYTRFTVFKADGTIANTGIPYYTDTWYDVTTKFDTDACTADVFVNNIYIGTYKFTADSGILSYRIDMKFNNENTEYLIDHFAAYKYADAPSVTGVTASKGGAVLGSTASDADTLTFKLDGALNAETVVPANVTLTADGEALSTENMTYDADANTITVPVSGLKPLTKAVLTLGNGVSNAENFYYHRPLTYAFDVAIPTVITVDNFDLSNADNIYTAKADIYYPLDDGKSAMLLIAGYEGNKLVAVNLDSKNLVNNDKNAFEVSQDMTGASEVKAFVWYKGSLAPFCVEK